jgi:RNA polymerase sigma factor (TIGR02999 family)
LQRERRGHTLQPTAIVHEAFLRLSRQQTVGWHNRAEFFRVAAQAMRRVLVDHARGVGATKRGGGSKRFALDDAVATFEQRAGDLVALDECLDRLADVDPRKARVIELRFFAGLTVEETAEVLNVPVRTIERDWTMAKAWLRAELAA